MTLTFIFSLGWARGDTQTATVVLGQDRKIRTKNKEEDEFTLHFLQ